MTGPSWRDAGDRGTPVQPEPPPVVPGGPGGEPVTLAALDCTARVGALAMTCAPAVPAADVVRWEGRRFSAARTMAAIGGVAVALAAVILVVSQGPIEAAARP